MLYGYDSFLFDFSKNDGVNTLKEIKNILEDDDYPTKIKMVTNINIKYFINNYVFNMWSGKSR